MRAGIEYYTATLSFDQERVPHSRVRLVFDGDLPEWVRVYEVDSNGAVHLLRDVPAENDTADVREYVDEAVDMPGRSTRLYLFLRRGTSPSRQDPPFKSLTK
jgi:hypothetical protein